MTPPEPVPVSAAIPERFRGLATAPVDPNPADRKETPQEAAQRRQEALQHVRARWERRLPLMYADASLDDLHPEQVRGGDWTWADESLNLVLAGGVGVGKTHAAYAIANDAAARGQVTEAWTVVDLLEALRPGHELERADSWCRRADVLVLDDLGATKVSEWAVEQMTALLDARLREGRRTIVTTNLTEDQLAGAWGERCMDRLRYRRTVKVLLGESRRKGAW